MTGVSAVWGRSVQRSQRIACRPSGIDPGVRPSEHRRGRSARKAAPAPKPVGAARSGRSLLNCVQQLSRRPGIDRPCFWQGRSMGDRREFSNREFASGWRGRDSGRQERTLRKNTGPARSPVENPQLRPPIHDSSRDLENQPGPRRGSGRLNATTKKIPAMPSNIEHT